MEFKEFTNPESPDYDIKKSLKEDEANNLSSGHDDSISQEISNLVGFLEQDELKKFNITFDEYMNPTIETLNKIKKYLENTKLNNDEHKKI